MTIVFLACDVVAPARLPNIFCRNRLFAPAAHRKSNYMAFFAASNVFNWVMCPEILLEKCLDIKFPV